MFNRFWRADPSRERRTGGTGLGLAIAREDALLHGGRLEAHGVPGIGSCFRLRLPLEPGGPVDTEPLTLEVPGAPAPAPRAEVFDALVAKREPEPKPDSETEAEGDRP